MERDRVEHRLQRERRIWRVGLLLSVLVHVVLFLVFRAQEARLTPYAAAGPAAGDPVAAPGGGGMRSVVLQPPQEIPVPPRPEVPVIKPVEVEPIEEEPVLALSELERPEPGEGEKEGPETGPGLPGAEGGGDAGNAATGLRRLLPPVPRGALFTPLAYRPNSVRGKEVTVWVFVNEGGAVDSVRLEPPTSDERFNRLLRREAREWYFEPAQRAGQPVATWYSYTWEL